MPLACKPCWSGLLGAELEGHRTHFFILTLPSILTSPALEASTVTRVNMVAPGVFIHGRGSTKPSRSRNDTL